MRKMAVMFATAAAIAWFSAPAPAQKNYTIAVDLKTLSSEYWESVKEGADKAAKDYGLQIDVQGPGAETEIKEQIEQIGQILAGNPDAVIIAPLDGEAVAEAIESSGYQGTVVFCDTDCDYKGKTAFVGTNNEEAAHDGGVYGVKIKGENTKALILYGQEDDRTSILRRKGYERALEEAGLQPVEEVSGNNTVEGSECVMKDILEKYPDGINLVLCHNDDTAIGAWKAVEETGRKGISIIGFDGIQSAVERIDSGDLTATIAQQPKLMGYMSVMTAVSALEGEDVEETVKINTVIIDAVNCRDYLTD